jgi:hypothetical protein
MIATLEDAKNNNMKFRFHRGGYKESMETEVEVLSFEQLSMIINDADIFQRKIVGYELTPQGKDLRNGWDSMLLSIKHKYEDEYTPIGYIDGNSV